MTLDEAIDATYLVFKSANSEKYIMEIHYDEDNNINYVVVVDEKADVRFKNRLLLIFNQLSYKDQIEISTIHPGVFYKMLDDDQKMAWKLMS